MEKLDSELKTKPSIKVKTYIQISHNIGTDKMFHFGPQGA